MLGAILGDMIGSPYEFDQNNIKTTEFPLWTARSIFTDDTVMTLAVAEGLRISYGKTENDVEQALANAMRRYGRLYPRVGYGGRFAKWLASDDMGAYNSFGNGAAMRVSAAAWLYDDLPKTEACAALTARVTHNHPEGLKGAQATAAAIFLARTGATKAEIKRYITQTYGYDLDQTTDAIRPTYHHDESCQATVPPAIIAFLESENFEHALRLAISLGGDSDTLAAITGSIAQGYYGIPQNLRTEALRRLAEPLRQSYERWEDFLQTRGKIEMIF